jgi:regulator of cell morphogenesis and NO signaling
LFGRQRRCCHGRRPLAEACAERGLEADRLLAEIATEEAATPALTRWDERPLPELVEHIVDFYHRRLRAELPELVALAAKVEARHADKATCPRGLGAHLEEVQRSVLEHLAKEEQILFPMILGGRAGRARLLRCQPASPSSPPPCCWSHRPGRGPTATRSTGRW